MAEKRVRVVTEENAPRTLNGKFAGGLPAPKIQGKEGLWLHFQGLGGSMILMDGEDEPRYIPGAHFHFVD
jgi:hypothetical protein